MHTWKNETGMENFNFHDGPFSVDTEELDTERKVLIDLYNAYYDNHPPFPRLDYQDPDRIKPRVSLALPKLFVNRKASALFGQDKFKGFQTFKFSDDSECQLLKEIWDLNKMDTKLMVLSKQALRLGDAFIKITYNPNSRAKVIYQRVNTQDIFPVLDYDNIEYPVGYVIQYKRPDNKWYREEITRTTTKTFIGEETREKDGVFQLRSHTEIRYTPQDSFVHNLGFLPIVRIRNNDPGNGDWWSQSIIHGLPPVLDSLNEILSNVCYAIGEQADPLLWLKGVKKGDNLFKDSDSVWYFESPDAALNVLQWEGTPESVFTAFNKLVDSAYECANIPLLLARNERISNVSGVALKILLQDMVDAVAEARSLWTESFKELFAKTMFMIEELDLKRSISQEEEDPERLEEEVIPYIPDFTIEWGDVLPRDEQIFNTDIYSGLEHSVYSRKEALRKKGYSEEYIEKILEEVKEDKEFEADSAADVRDAELEVAREHARAVLNESAASQGNEDTDNGALYSAADHRPEKTVKYSQRTEEGGPPGDTE